MRFLRFQNPVRPLPVISLLALLAVILIVASMVVILHRPVPETHTPSYQAESPGA